ncbi:hypothetical protein FKM82_002954 [Ascaphus truei]
MDFLWLFTMYVVFLLVCVSVFCLLSGRSRSNSNRISNYAEMVSHVLPAWLQRYYHRALQTRSRAFVILHLILDALVFAEYSWEVFGYCWELELKWLYIFLPYALITINLYYFYLCCVTDPGTLTRQNEVSYMQVYDYDDIMFHRDRRCPTCQLLKPARSKHCSVCKGCVQRFDHHCVWVNNCVGAFNIRYFLFYLLSLTLAAVSVAGVITAFLLQVVLLSHMMTAAYIDVEGHEHLMSIAFIIQVCVDL